MSIKRSASERLTMDGLHGAANIAEKLKRKSSFARRDLGESSLKKMTHTSDKVADVDDVTVFERKNATLQTTVWHRLSSSRSKLENSVDDHKPPDGTKGDIMSRIRERQPDYTKPDHTKYNERLDRARTYGHVDEMIPKEEDDVSINDEDEEYDDENDAKKFVYVPKLRLKVSRLRRLLSFRRKSKASTIGEADEKTTSPT